MLGQCPMQQCPVYPGKQETLNQCWVDVRPASQTVGKRQPNIGSISRVHMYPRKHKTLV